MLALIVDSSFSTVHREEMMILLMTTGIIDSSPSCIPLLPSDDPANKQPVDVSATMLHRRKKV